MSKNLAQYMSEQKRMQPRQERAPLSSEERLALHKLRTEARKAGARLATGGRGGISPSLALFCFRRDGYRCQLHGDRGQGENGGLTLHHRGGIVASQLLSKMGHKNIPENLQVICELAHDEVHDAARAEGIDSSQVEPEGDR